jgi:predicted extracellular nuclease
MTFPLPPASYTARMRILLFLVVTANVMSAANTFTVASHNVENYFLSPFGTRKSKPAVSRAKVREAILKIQPDVLALQEIGRRVALNELLAG